MCFFIYLCRYFLPNGHMSKRCDSLSEGDRKGISAAYRKVYIPLIYFMFNWIFIWVLNVLQIFIGWANRSDPHSHMASIFQLGIVLPKILETKFNYAVRKPGNLMHTCVPMQINTFCTEIITPCYCTDTFYALVYVRCLAAWTCFSHFWCHQR